MTHTMVEQTPLFLVLCWVNGEPTMKPASTRGEALAHETNAAYEGPGAKAIYRRVDDPRHERIQNPAVLVFDPTQTQNEKLKQIFADETARTLWCAIGQKHLRNQNFNQGCLKAAELIRQQPPSEPHELRTLMLRALGEFRGVSPEFWHELLPYVQGKRGMGFTVEPQP